MDAVIGILHQVRQHGFDIHLHILGGLDDSPFAKKVQALASRPRDWVFLEGRVAGKTKRELMARHRFGINGRKSEPFGIAVAELVKAGCLTFVPNGGGQTEIVDHPSLIFENDDDAIQKIVVRAAEPSSTSGACRPPARKEPRAFHGTLPGYRPEPRGGIPREKWILGLRLFIVVKMSDS